MAGVHVLGLLQVFRQWPDQIAFEVGAFVGRDRLVL